MSAFFAQGGYGFFVWSAYGMAAIVLIAEVMQLRARQRALLARLARLQRLAGTASTDTQGTLGAAPGQRQAK